MIKGKLIYWFGILFLIITLLKYLYVPTVFPPVYFTFEVIGVLLVLFMVFYTKSFLMPKSSCREKELDYELLKLKEENTKQFARIQELEMQDEEVRTFASIKEKLVSELIETVKSGKQDELGLSLFSLIKSHFELVGGIVYLKSDSEQVYQPIKTYGLDEEVDVPLVIAGEGLHGQAIVDKKAKEIDEIPEDYLEVSSGIGSAQPAFIYFLPIIDLAGNDILIEVASFKKLGMDIIWNEFLGGLKGQGNN